MGERNITHVILWTNGMVSVFDQDGAPMPNYQGQYGEVRDRILVLYRDKWELAEWDKGVLATFYPGRYLPLKGV